MKRVLLVAMALLMLANTGTAQAPDSCYVGLFADVDHSVRRVDYAGGFTMLTMYIWWLPSARGIRAAEFAISYPANVIQATVTANPSINVSMGSLPAGISFAFESCNEGGVWFESHHQTCYLTSNVVGQFEMIKHPGLIPPAYQIAGCDSAQGYPIEPVKRLTHLYVNWDGGISAESSSWGAIKSLF